tara:strand:- start:70 stop:708 length:639 start_codon:yes stop_codon:yes gene_type:complete
LETIKPNQNSPLIRLISLALEVWIKNKCIDIESIKIRIKGSILKIIRGKIEGISLKASKVNFKEIHIDRINILSDPIEIRSNKKNKQGLLKSQEFNIEGELVLTEENINKIINSNTWKWVNRWLQENLLISSEPYVIKITEHSLLIKSIKLIETNQSQNEILNFKVEKGSLFFKSIKDGKLKLLPMDPSIKIKSMIIKKMKISLNFESKVKI